MIEVGDRTAYLSALDRAGIDISIQPFAEFIATSVVRSTKQLGPQGLSVLEELAAYDCDRAVVSATRAQSDLDSPGTRDRGCFVF